MRPEKNRDAWPSKTLVVTSSYRTLGWKGLLGTSNVAYSICSKVTKCGEFTIVIHNNSIFLLTYNSV
jgi:hypothetical protein